MTFKEFTSLYQKSEVTEYKNNVSNVPVVSVCVLAYNHGNFISNCLDSILMQETTFPFEILISEDNSDDNTRGICEKYAQKHPDLIKLYLHNRNNNILINEAPTGLFSALYNLFQSKGKFIAYCDGDDYWTDPKKLQLQVDYLKNNKEYVLAYHDVNYIDLNNSPIYDNRIPKSRNCDISALALRQQEFQPLPVTICFRNIIRDIPIEMTQTTNGDNFWISLLGNYGSGKFLIDIAPSKYRVHDGGFWSSKSKENKFKSKINTYKTLSSYYKKVKNIELSIYFKLKQSNYTKMLLYYYLINHKYMKIVKSLTIVLKTY